MTGRTRGDRARIPRRVSPDRSSAEARAQPVQAATHPGLHRPERRAETEGEVAVRQPFDEGESDGPHAGRERDCKVGEFEGSWRVAEIQL